MLQNLFYNFPPCTVFFHKNLYQKKMILLYEGSQTWQFHKKYMMESFMKAWYAYTKKRKVAMFIIGINWYFTITYSDIQINKNSVRSRILQLDDFWKDGFWNSPPSWRTQKITNILESFMKRFCSSNIFFLSIFS